MERVEHGRISSPLPGADNLATLASAVSAVEVELDAVTDAVEDGLGPREVVVAAPRLDVEVVGLPTTVDTTADGRWQVTFAFEGFTLCGSDVDVRFLLLIDDVPVASTVLYADQNDGIRARLSGPTERVLPAGAHELNVGTECVGPEFFDAAVIGSDGVYSIVVLPESGQDKVIASFAPRPLLAVSSTAHP